MIRKYRAEDLEDLLTAWESASVLAHPFLSEEFLAAERNNIANVYLPHAETWVWESDGPVVGFLSLIDNEIGGLFVDPKYHRLGIGRALLDHARQLRDNLEVEVFKENVIGRKFYAKYGFVPMHEKVHDETGLEILRLRLAAGTPMPPIVS